MVISSILHMNGFVSIPPTSLWLHHDLLYLPQEAMPQRCYAENAIGGGAELNNKRFSVLRNQ